jgi:hypothetical protein
MNAELEEKKVERSSCDIFQYITPRLTVKREVVSLCSVN